ncbi:MAG: hypothetical protein FWD82_04845 [Defluviitaleaceae bacterium]|nr:hypothetical protein [Defluviitaleaceae bacterium]
MKITFKNLGFSYSIDSIMMFQNQELSNFWMSSLFHFFPSLDREKLSSLDALEKKEYLTSTLKLIYDELEPEFAEKIVKYNDYFNLHKSQIEDAFSDAFGIDCKNNFNDIVGNITLNPICPRFLDKREFDIFYLNSERGALGIALHEIIHFVWFDVWQNYFKDNKEDYEIPHIKWIFSEMAVYPIMRKDARLSEINPYYGSNAAVYPYFYTMKIENEPILETLYKMYCNSSNIIEFMESGYTYCLKYEKEIRNQME